MMAACEANINVTILGLQTLGLQIWKGFVRKEEAGFVDGGPVGWRKKQRVTTCNFLCSLHLTPRGTWAARFSPPLRLQRAVCSSTRTVALPATYHAQPRQHSERD